MSAVVEAAGDTVPADQAGPVLFLLQDDPGQAFFPERDPVCFKITVIYFFADPRGSYGGQLFFIFPAGHDKAPAGRDPEQNT